LSDFPFEFKSANFRRIGQTVFERAWKYFALLDQCVVIAQNKRVEMTRSAAVQGRKGGGVGGDTFIR
jgi:hypothetical protein